MKNKIFYCVFLIIFPSLVLSNEFEFNASEIESYNNGNMIKGFGGVQINDGLGLTITGEKFEFDNSFNLGTYGYGNANGYVGAFGAFASVDDFVAAGNNGLLSEALANAQAVADADTWSLAETNVGQLAFYIQDEWDVNDDFKFTYGLRFDKPLYFDTDEKAGDVIAGTGDYAPNTPYVNPNTGDLQLLDNTQMPSSSWLFSPRIGFNYDVNSDNTLQLRGGSGIFSGRIPFV